MVGLLIAFLLFIGTYAGYKRGIILQLLQTIGYAVSFLVAMDNYRWLSERLFLLIPYSTPFAPETNPYPFHDESLLFSLTDTYYDLIAFLILLFIGWVIVRFFAALLSYTLEKVKAPEPVNGIGGAILGFVVNYIGIFYLLFFLTVIPFAPLQNRLINSSLASGILTATPQLSESTYQQFVLDVYEENKAEEPELEVVPTEELEEQMEVPPEESTDENSE